MFFTVTVDIQKSRRRPSVKDCLSRKELLEQADEDIEQERLKTIRFFLHKYTYM